MLEQAVSKPWEASGRDQAPELLLGLTMMSWTICSTISALSRGPWSQGHVLLGCFPMLLCCGQSHPWYSHSQRKQTQNTVSHHPSGATGSPGRYTVISTHSGDLPSEQCMTSVLPFVYSAKSPRAQQPEHVSACPQDWAYQQSTLKNKQGRGFVSLYMSSEHRYSFKMTL